MARLVFISPYLKGGRDASHLAHRVRYYATREGVELLPDENAAFPATQKQDSFISRLVREFPTVQEMLEYEDYLAAPTKENAAEFIKLVWEQYIDPLDKRESFVDYIANRPGVQLTGEHGLWNADGKVPVLSQAVEEIANHRGNVWTPVVSLRRDDAERLGYDNAENWRALVNASICDIAKGYKIPVEHLRWYAAFHEKDRHVHIHMIIFSTDPREGYLTKQGIRDIKSAFAKAIFRDELLYTYQKQTEYRSTLQQEAESMMSELIYKMEHGDIKSEKLERLTAALSERLKYTAGKKVYGYLPPRVKAIVDEIVDELAKDERVAAAYALWQEMRDEVCRTYSEKLPERLPISKQKEFKPVRNMVIREAMKLSDMSFSFDDEAMNDEPEETPADAPQRTQAVYRQAEHYRRAKRSLTDEDAPAPEKTAALTTLERLWEMGLSVAAHQLGKVYRDGVYVRPDADTAVKWFRRSADAGNDYSEYALGKLLLEHGNTDEGIRWLKRAAAQDNQYARYRLGKVYLTGNAVTKDIPAALEYLTAAARQGNQYAQYTLGKLYLLGKEVEQDRDAAVRWFNLAAAQGNAYAQYFLDHRDDFHGGSVGSAVIRMLHHMAGIFRENAATGDAYRGMQIDKKRRRKLREKKMAMGHKPDDHEDGMNMYR